MENTKVGNYEVKVERDPYGEDFNPRDWDNLGTWVCNHRRYALPNEIDFNFNTFNSWRVAAAELSKRYDYVLALYMYEHSGLSFNLCGLSPYWQHGRWGGGQVGFVVANKSDVRKWFGVKKVTAAVETRFYNTLRGEVADYQLFSNGEVYSFDVLDENGTVVDHACGIWGFNQALQEGIAAAMVLEPETITA